MLLYEFMISEGKMNAWLYLDSEFPIAMLTLNFQDVFVYIKHNGSPMGCIITIKKGGEEENNLLTYNQHLREGSNI